MGNAWSSTEIPRGQGSGSDYYAVGELLVGAGDVGGGDVGGGGVVGGVGVCGGWVCGGELLCGGVGVGEGADAAELLCTGDVDGVLFVGPGTAVGLLVALPPVPLFLAWPCAELVDDAGLLVAGPAPDPPVLRGSEPVGPADWLGASVLPALCVVSDDAAE